MPALVACCAVIAADIVDVNRAGSVPVRADQPERRGNNPMPDEHVHIAGDGAYGVEAIGETCHQEALEWLVRGRGDEPVHYTCTAELAGDPDSESTIGVSVFGRQVGHLPAEIAACLLESMQAWGFETATCNAVIEGGWYRAADDKGDFVVRLDMTPDCEPLFDDDEDSPALTAAAATATPDRPAAARIARIAVFAICVVAALTTIAWVAMPEPMPAGGSIAIAVTAPIPLLVEAEPPSSSALAEAIPTSLEAPLVRELVAAIAVSERRTPAPEHPIVRLPPTRPMAARVGRQLPRRGGPRGARAHASDHRTIHEAERESWHEKKPRAAPNDAAMRLIEGGFREWSKPLERPPRGSW